MIQSRESRGSASNWIRLGAAVILLSLGSLSASAQELDRCVRAWVSYPIVLPDGSTHEPGVLELCLRGKSPVSGRHEIRVNGAAIGQWPSRMGLAEDGGGSPSVVVLSWTPEGNLRLAGYTSPERGTTVIYMLDACALEEDLYAGEPTLRELFDGPNRMTLLADAGR